MSKNQSDLNIGVVNPYALAELITEKKINWKEQKNTRYLLEEILERPYEKLFDPKFDSPLYPGVRLQKNNKIKKVSIKEIKVRDLSIPTEIESILSEITKLSDLKKKKEFSKSKIEDLPIINAELLPDGTLSLQIDMSEIEKKAISNTYIDSKVLPYLLTLKSGSANTEWTPSGSSWQDIGNFFNEAAEGNDPVQGAVANCYFMAALSSVAWTYPYVIAHRTRASGIGQQQFLNKIKLFSKGGGKDSSTREIEVSEQLITNASGNLRYARSSENAEIWCGVYEKAFAKWITENNTDRPDITATAFGDCVKATAQLIDGDRTYFRTSDYSANDIYTSVRRNSMSRKTINPMTAWTYSSGDSSPDKVIYSDANLVANHCYSIFGWAYNNGRKYIVLRNPWGSTEATGNVLTGTWMAFDNSFWRPIALTNNDGIFALEASTFKQYFAGWGISKIGNSLIS